MGGLLDKANQYQDSVHQGDNVANKTVNSPDAIIDAYEKGKASKSDHTTYDSNSSLLAKNIQYVAEDGGINSNLIIGMQVAGSIAFLVSLFLLIQVGWLYATLLDYLLAIGIMIVGWGLINGSDFISSSLSNVKMIATGVAFVGLFSATIFGTSMMNAGGGVTIATLELDGANDEIDLSFYGPSGMDYTVEVLVDGNVEYTYDGEINIDRGSHSIAIDEFWSGNSMNMNDQSLITYEVKVTSEGGEDTVKFDNLMNREVDTGYVKVNEVYSTDTQGTKEYTGISVEMIIGMGDPEASFDFSNNYFTGTEPKPIASDWSATLVVKKGTSTEYTYATIQANEGVVNGLGDFWNNWVLMPGTTAGNLDRDDFYNGDGCYTFEVSIENVLGDSYVVSDSQINFSWESNEASEGSDEAASKC